MKNKIVDMSQRMRALILSELSYADNDFQCERCHELLQLTENLMSIAGDVRKEDIHNNFSILKEYATSKLEVRAVVFNDKREILLVKEKCDGGWSIPGGWSDVGYSPKESVLKELEEETGIKADVKRVLALVDKKNWNHPASNLSVYKCFVLCEIKENASDKFSYPFDILDSHFFSEKEIPALSRDRTSMEEVKLMFEFYDCKTKEMIID